MKRLALLAVTAFVAVLISACGENSQKGKVVGPPNSVQQGSGTNTGTSTTTPAGQ